MHKHLFDYFYTAPNFFKIIDFVKQNCPPNHFIANYALSESVDLSVARSATVLILHRLGPFSYFFSCIFALLPFLSSCLYF